MREEDRHLAVKINRLTKKFKAAGIDDVSFEVHQNEVFGLLGNNGCGKTTIINIIAGIV
jgi:ABC-type multidrug transport system ATPase subunit